MNTQYKNSKIIGTCFGGGYKYAHTSPIHPKANSKGLYPLHRILIENKIGRYLNHDEVVHHKDGNKFNNDLDNLVLITNREHSKLHSHSLPTALCKCPVCKIVFSIKEHCKRLRIKRNVSHLIFCSRECGRKYYLIDNAISS